MVSNLPKNLPDLLIADDERTTREALMRFLRKHFNVTGAEDGTVAVNLLKSNHFDIVLTDLRMPGADGMQVLKYAVSLPAPPVVLVFSAYGGVSEAVAAVKAGAFDFVVKPVKLDDLEAKLNMALAACRSRSASASADAAPAPAPKGSSGSGGGMVIGASQAMRELLEAIETAAPTRATVLLTGESGTGKEVAARMIHEKSGRSGRFVPVHCAALAETLLESELFGHEKGAFTGAVETRKGRFEIAADGTLFLDEIGEISPATQVKLLRVLENRVFERVGGTEEIRSTARIVAATNRDLARMTAEGTFREDLFYRLNVINLRMPPLRERTGDIPLLAEAFLKDFAEEDGRDIAGFTPEAMAAMCAYPWPGNVRELRNVVERLAVFTPGGLIGLDDLPEAIREPGAASDEKSHDSSLDLENNELKLIERALAECGNNRTKAAEKLGISRRTLHRKIKEFNL